MMLSINNLDRICLLVVIAAISLGGFWIFRQGIEQRSVIRQQKDLLSSRMEDLTLADENLRRLRSLVDDKARQLQALNEKIPDSAEIGKFIRQVATLIKAREISLLNIQPQAILREPAYKKIPIQIILTGSFLNTYHLLRDFEGMDRLMDIERMLIAKVGGGGNCRIDMTANVFER